ncbi:hypothetical protein [Chitinimonas lacunae]|uniref:Uncharacterized protein n=1 Tax=Chitinimonas lacunae TaxID=1963018 RepID=A0ABV8MJS3_9NEIS
MNRNRLPTRTGLAIALGTGLALFLGSVWYAERRRLAEQNRPRPPKKVEPQQLQTWEGEGGNVPEVSTPRPAEAPLASRAPSSSAMPASSDWAGPKNSIH